MADLLDILTTYTAPRAERSLRSALTAHTTDIQSARGGPERASAARTRVMASEQVVRIAPAYAFTYAENGSASLRVGIETWQAGRFEVASLAALRTRLPPRQEHTYVRLWVLDGDSPITDIGAMQATASSRTLFQVASQFNCLEAPGPRLVPVSDYFNDPTQGPRAAISAFPATLLRHYQAPAPAGMHFTQASDGRQIDLLAGACGPGWHVNGYLTGVGKSRAECAAFTDALETHFDELCVGIHTDAQVMLGANWYGTVTDSAHRRIAQVFTSTIAGGGYGGERTFGSDLFPRACRQLLRASYLGTLLAALAHGQRHVVLTLIGGGAFGNPVGLIWECIQWAVREIEPVLTHELEVIVNGRNLGAALDLETEIAPVVQAHGGLTVRLDSAGGVQVWH